MAVHVDRAVGGNAHPEAGLLLARKTFMNMFKTQHHVTERRKMAAIFLVSSGAQHRRDTHNDECQLTGEDRILSRPVSGNEIININSEVTIKKLVDMVRADFIAT